MGLTRNEIDKKIDDILDLDIGEFIDQPFKTYSSGMKTRLAFSIAINLSPEILIIDEVLAVGDELFKRKCYAKMEELFNSRSRDLCIHSLGAINKFCSRAVLVDRGEILLDGPSKIVTQKYPKYVFVGKVTEKKQGRN